MRKPRKKFDPIRLFHKIKLLAFEAGITIVFIFWVVKEIRDQLEWDQHKPPSVTKPEADRPPKASDDTAKPPDSTAHR